MAQITIDTRGLRCPLPVLKMETRLRRLGADESLLILADDPIAKIDIPHAARSAGYVCESVPTQSSSECVFKVTRPQDR